MTNKPIRSVQLPKELAARREALVTREWLVTNGIGGFASGTIADIPSRRYHGLLVASLPNPLGRSVMLTELRETLQLADGTVCQLGGEERVSGELHLPGVEFLESFHLESGLPVWRYRAGRALIEKRIVMPHHQNTVFISYSLVEGDGPIRLRLRPGVNFRAQELPVSNPLAGPYVITALDDRLEIALEPMTPRLRMMMFGGAAGFMVRTRVVRERLYRVEERRGYDSEGALWSPGEYEVRLSPGEGACLLASTEPWEVALALSPQEAREAELERRAGLLQRAGLGNSGPEAELVLAADAFVVSPGYRAGEVARSRAVGEEMRTVIAGYHWFTDWGRDTMIALEGLTLATGRHREAGAILRAFAAYTRNGLIPNMFPEGSSDGLYHTADATLWFFHAVDRYLQATSDRQTLRTLIPTLTSIVEHHLRGTDFGIRIDPADGLLTQGEEGYQLTWMDAKVDDWVVTPRRGKAVELNALWYNALRLLEGWLREEGDDQKADELASHAARTHESFNARFWFEQGGYLYDIVDGEEGDDHACRPNQIFALSLPNPVLDEGRWEQVLEVVRRELLTPVGLRSLSRDHPEYRPTYDGDLRTRDGAYHQGTVWGWLIGPFVDAWLRVYPQRTREANEMLQGLVDHLDEFGVGSVAEIFDAEPPFTPRGCIAQAWSVSELLRSLIRTA